MCSIYGVVFADKSPTSIAKMEELAAAAGDRGRDGGRRESFTLRSGKQVVLGNWRATPTPEIEKAPLQPYDGVVHNGTIANDRELGAREGEVDSMVLPRILERNFDLRAFVNSIEAIKGSFAIAAVGKETLFLACNYKPVYFWVDVDGNFFFSSLERHFDAIVPFGQRPEKLAPYSAMDVCRGKQRSLFVRDDKKAIVIASAGLDSTVVAQHLVQQGWHVRMLHFRYGCRAERNEARRIPMIASAIGCEFDILDLPYSGIGGSSLLDRSARITGGVEGAEFAHEWVPARNLVMLSLATAYAEAHGFHRIALGNNLEESGAYPDNEEEFTILFSELLPYATRASYRVSVLMPVANLMKHEIVAMGLREGAPLQLTWSCYRSGPVHCGKCGPCFMRREAFARNGTQDPVFEGAPCPPTTSPDASSSTPPTA